MSKRYGAGTVVCIIDYKMGNLFSVQRVCEHAGVHAIITNLASKVMEANGLILPGVGAFGDAMKNLKDLDLILSIKDFIASGRPFLGVCLGMQLLMSESEEFGHHQGLDVIKGSVVRFPQSQDNGKMKVPQVGWNQIFPARGLSERFWANTPLRNLESGEYMYFVHSYYVKPQKEDGVLSKTNYAGVEYCSSFLYKNIFATQFHPERSAAAGIQIYKNWASAILRKANNFLVPHD